MLPVAAADVASEVALARSAGRAAKFNPFTGTARRKIDSKGRVVLPAIAIREIRRTGGVVYVAPNRLRTGIDVFPSAVFERLVLGPSRRSCDPHERRRLDVLIASAERVCVRGPGRITIPASCRVLFPAEEVFVVGRCDFLEVVGVVRGTAL